MSKKLPKYIEKDKVEKMIDQIDGNLRDKLIIKTMFQTGLRNSEIRNLKLYHVDLNNREITVRDGKGKKDRVVPFPKSLKNSLESYIYMRKQMDDNTSYLFVRRYAGKYDKLSASGIEYIIKKYSEKADVSVEDLGYIYPHILRHSYAVHILRNNGDLRTVQKNLGHENLSTTQKYLDITADDRKRVIDKCNLEI